MGNLNNVNEMILALSIDLREISLELRDLAIKRDQINKQLVDLVNMQNELLDADIDKIKRIDIFPDVILSTND
jgi:hypothetical protein